jgi:hypothetical protein
MMKSRAQARGPLTYPLLPLNIPGNERSIDDFGVSLRTYSANMPRIANFRHMGATSIERKVKILQC